MVKKQSKIKKKNRDLAMLFTLVSDISAVRKGTWLNLLYVFGIIAWYFIHINEPRLCCVEIYCTKKFKTILRCLLINIIPATNLVAVSLI